MKVLVLNPASSGFVNVVRDQVFGCWCKGKEIGGMEMPPLSLLYVATILQKAGHDVVFIDEVPKTSVGKFSKKDLRERFKDHVLPAT